MRWVRKTALQSVQPGDEEPEQNPDTNRNICVVLGLCGCGTLNKFNATAQLFKTAIHQSRQLVITTGTVKALKGQNKRDK